MKEKGEWLVNRAIDETEKNDWPEKTVDGSIQQVDEDG